VHAVFDEKGIGLVLVSARFRLLENIYNIDDYGAIIK
jgi:hypothetical protein